MECPDPAARPPPATLLANAEAVIVNCSTKELSALALASALARSTLPVTVFDCESTDGSVAFFRRLQERLSFRLAHLPLARHGDTLDRIFRETDREALLLIDSDAEIRRDDLVPAMATALRDCVYGSGFLHPGQWLSTNHLVAGEIGYYAPRMWIPCVLLRTPPVQRALAAGASFHDRVACNELPQFPGLARLLYLRFRVPLLRRIELERLARWRRPYFGAFPHYVYFDTGAELHRHLVESEHLALAELPAELWASGVHHEHGVTRRRLAWRMRNASDVERARRDALLRLESVYGITV
jgi:hypothetical protein